MTANRCRANHHRLST